LENDAVEALMSARFESQKSKEWLERQIAIKESATRATESEAAVERIMEMQEMIANTAEHAASSEVTRIGNIPD
jgi:hypothetical protein